MLSALVTNDDVRSSFAGAPDVTDIAIYEFDYWINPTNARYGASTLTYTYCEPDCTPEQSG